nr:probable flavin-containing monoamine oxidase A isoform X1 [Leptinotarsa decemlineata]
MYKSIDADVIIVGAGLSGLTAAYHLLKKEPYLRVIIFESSEQIGGRIPCSPFTNSSGQWVCSEQTQLLELLEELHIPLIRTQTNPGNIVIKYKRISTAQKKKNILDFLTATEKIQFTKFILKVEIICRNIKEETKPTWIDELRKITLRTFIQDTVGSDTVRLVIDFMIYLTCGVKSSQVSALFYVLFCISTKGIIHQMITEEKNLCELRLKNSLTNICEKLAERIGTYYILTKENVLEVECTDKYAEITTNLGSYCCHNVIVAVPPADILKIKFTPDLPQSKYDSISDVTSNIMTSFVATYRKEFWMKLGLSGDIYSFDKDYSEGPIDFCCNITQFDIPALYGLLFSEKITSPSLPIYKRRILKQLSEYFGKEALNPVEYYERSWHNRSSRMFCWKEGNNKLVHDIEQVNRRIHWAGAETSNEWFGQMAGAVHSGIRAALEVLCDLRPSVLTADDYMFLRPPQRTQKKPLETYNDPIYSFLANWRSKLSIGLLILLIMYGLKTYLVN